MALNMQKPEDILAVVDKIQDKALREEIRKRVEKALKLQPAEPAQE